MTANASVTSAVNAGLALCCTALLDQTTTAIAYREQRIQLHDPGRGGRITEKPSAGMAEYPLGKQVLASSPSSAQALEKCKDNTRGLWPSRTSRGDPRTTQIGAGLEP